MANLQDVYQHLISIKNPKIKDYWDHLNVILRFVDDQFYDHEDLIYSFSETNENGFRVPLYFNSDTSKIDVWKRSKVENSINAVADVFASFFSIRQNILKQSVFLELKSMVSFFTHRIFSDKNLLITDLMPVTNYRLFLQCEFYEYMYAYFDKLNYIFLHLNEKYITKGQGQTSPIDVRFHIDFQKNVLPFVKDDESKVMIKEVVQKITNSTIWHFTRKLRNNVAHDFVDPSLRYNLNYETKLLYINICRIVFLLDATIMKDDDIYELVQKLRDK